MSIKKSSNFVKEWKNMRPVPSYNLSLTFSFFRSTNSGIILDAHLKKRKNELLVNSWSVPRVNASIINELYQVIKNKPEGLFFLISFSISIQKFYEIRGILCHTRITVKDYTIVKPIIISLKILQKLIRIFQ